MPEKAMFLISNPMPAGAAEPSAESSPRAHDTYAGPRDTAAGHHPRARLTRAAQVFGSLARCAVALLTSRLLRRNDAAADGRQVQACLQELGGVWILLSRALAIRYDLFPADFCDALGKITDVSPPLAARLVIRVIERELGRPIDRTFSCFDHVPANTTWRAQEHHAVLRDGEMVAVMVRRPGLVPEVEADLTFVRGVLRLLDFLVVPGHVRLSAGYPEFRRTVLEHASLTVDGRNADRLAAQCDTNPNEYVPHVYWALSTSELLTLERLDNPSVADIMEAVREGTSLSTDPSEPEIFGIDPAAVARSLLFNCLGQIFDGRYLLRELTPEQLVVMPGDGVGYRELSSLGRIDSSVRRHQLGLVSALRSADVDAFFEIMLELIDPPCDADLIALEQRFKSRVWLWLDRNENAEGDEADRRVSPLLRDIFDDVRQLRIPVASAAAMALAATLADLEEIVYTLAPAFDMRAELTAFFRTALVSRVRRQMNLQALSDVVLDYEHMLLALPGYMRQSMHVAQQSRAPLVRRVDSWRVGWWDGMRRLATTAIAVGVLAWIAVTIAPESIAFPVRSYVSPAGWIVGLAALIVLRRIAVIRYGRHAAGEWRVRRSAA